MSVPFEEQHSVWTDNPDPEWERRNATTAMRLVGGVSQYDARLLCQRLLLLLPTATFWVTDIRENETDRFELRPPIESSARPATRVSEATRDARAANGHVMTYRVVPPMFPGGDERLSQWDAEHSDNCPCHASGEYEPLPDW